MGPCFKTYPKWSDIEEWTTPTVFQQGSSFLGMILTNPGASDNRNNLQLFTFLSETNINHGFWRLWCFRIILSHMRKMKNLRDWDERFAGRFCAKELSIIHISCWKRKWTSISDSWSTLRRCVLWMKMNNSIMHTLCYDLNLSTSVMNLLVESLYLSTLWLSWLRICLVCEHERDRCVSVSYVCLLLKIIMPHRGKAVCKPWHLWGELYVYLW